MDTNYIKEAIKLLAIVIAGLMLIILITSMLGCKSSGSSYTQKSAIDPRRQVIYSSSDNEKGYLQQSATDSRRTVQYDKKGNSKGYWQKSAIDPRKSVFHKK